jgi:hypothetical protein
MNQRFLYFQDGRLARLEGRTLVVAEMRCCVALLEWAYCWLCVCILLELAALIVFIAEVVPINAAYFLIIHI